MADILNVYTDASVLDEHNSTSIGFLVKKADGTILAREHDTLDTYLSSGVAEYAAITRALDYVNSHWEPRHVTVYTDSTSCARVLSPQYPDSISSERAKPYADAAAHLLNLFQSTELHDIQRHRNPADALATRPHDPLLTEHQ